MLRWLGKAIVAIAPLAGFTGLASVLHVRSAIAAGALQEPRTCLEKPHRDWRYGRYPARQRTWLSANQVRYHYLGDRRAELDGWHLRGMFAGLGVWLGYSAQQQHDMAMEVISAMPDCPPRRRDRSSPGT